MKEIKAYVEREQVDAVVDALEAAGAPAVTIVRVDDSRSGEIHEQAQTSTS